MPSQVRTGPWRVCPTCGTEFQQRLPWRAQKYDKQICLRPAGRKSPTYDWDARFWAKVDKNGPIPLRYPDLGSCWIWLGATSGRTGYGQLTLHNQRWLAHRRSWVLAGLGDLPPIYEGDLCHRCDNPPCVRPSHLFLDTHKANMHDSIAKGRADMTFGRTTLSPDELRTRQWTTRRAKYGPTGKSR